MTDSIYVPVIGMEIHAELKTNSKMFCGCKNDPFRAPKPNMYTCPVCLGMPGALPVPNKKAIEWTILLGLALDCEISLFSKFDRKNYFYPDLAKGYQISQYDQPFAINGRITYQVSGSKEEQEVRIRRVHLEEDTGKLHHETINGKNVTLVDFNRSGVPLVEIVTEPDIHSGEEAKAFLKKLHQIIRYLDISEADMEKGTMRLEPNISVAKGVVPSGNLRSDPGNLPDYKVEVKNINSFNFVKKAIEFEVKRHITILETGTLPVQETRGWSEAKGETVSQRRKENANDYRYFPEPDIPPIRLTKEYIESLRKTLPELPKEKSVRLKTAYELPDADIEQLIEDPKKTAYFEKCIPYLKGTTVTAKMIANWMINKKTDITTISPEALVKQITQATTVVAISDEEIQKAIAQVTAANPKAVAEYKAGKEPVFMFLFGQTMKALQGRGDKGKIQEILKQSLSSH